jgi:hypothetical protein
MRALPVLAAVALLVTGLVARASIPQADPPVAATDTSLRAIACPAAEPCIAVGLTGSKYTVRVPLIAHTAAGSWSVRSLPGMSPAGDSLLAALSCPSTIRCVAVGRHEVPAPYLGARSAGDRPLTELWDGTSWTAQRAVVPPRTADAELRGVDCDRTMCMAVGSYARRLGDDRPLAEMWNGDTWTLRLPRAIRAGHEASDGVLSDVACVSATSCIAVGRFSYDFTFFTGVAPLIQRWDGSGWRIDRSANTKSLDTELNGVACPSTDRCIAVGLQRSGPGVFGPFAEIWDGERWKMMRVAGPPRSPDAELLDVACPLPDRCVAVGLRATGARYEPLIETWDGSRWTIEPFEPPADFTSSALDSVDCSSPTRCHAVGTYTRATPLLHAFSVSLDDGHPTVVPVPDA